MVDGNLELAGKGIGTEIYKNAINYMKRGDRSIQMLLKRSQQQECGKDKLKSTGSVKRMETGIRSSLSFHPFDKNQEVLPK
jgi:hypothetical protein